MMRTRLVSVLAATAAILSLAVGVAAQTKVVRVGGAVRAPRPISHVDPVYPEEAKAQGVSGVVIIEMKLDTEGSVSTAQVLRSVPLLDQAALDAVFQWKYEPTLLNGEPVEVIMTVTVNFTLK